METGARLRVSLGSIWEAKRRRYKFFSSVATLQNMLFLLDKLIISVLRDVL